MRAIILAAGMGTRMGGYTADRPKGMLEFGGIPLLQRQAETLMAAGASDLVVVTGYRSECIDVPGARYVRNQAFETTNMVESLLMARDFLDDDVLVGYGDIIFERQVAEAVAASLHDVAVAVDEEWHDYWRARYGTTEEDLETLTVDEQGLITEIGQPVGSSEGIGPRYVGLLKFSRKGLAGLLALYDAKKERGESWRQSGNEFLQGYMTDLLSEYIGAGNPVHAVAIRKGWLEFDTGRDFELAQELLASGRLGELIDLEG